MGPVRLVTDSPACLSPETRARLGIEMVGIYLVLDGRPYRDSVDLTAEEFYPRLAEFEKHTTAAPSVADWVEVLQRAVAAGAGALLVITLARKLSSTFDAARLAAQMIPVPTAVIDSRTAAAAEGLYVRRLAEEAQQGATLEQLVERAERRRGSYSLELVIAGLGRLAASGRMPTTAARLGDAVNLKALLSFDEYGAVRVTGAARGMRRGLERIHRRVLGVFPEGTPGRAVVTHALLADEAEELARRLRSERPELEVDVAVFSPVMGSTTGPILGVAWEDPSVLAETPSPPRPS